MKKLFNKINRKANETYFAVRNAACTTLTNEQGEFYVDKTVGIIIVVVLGAALLTAMIAIFGDETKGVIGTVKTKITELFS